MLPFNNREIATAFWLFAFLIFVLSKSDVRKSVKDVFAMLLEWRISLSLFLMLAITSSILYLLNYFSLRNMGLMKDTVIWFLFAGVPLYVRWITSKSDQNIFKKIVIENIKLILLIEFVVNVYTFSLITELILVPFVSFVVMLNTYAEIKQPNSTVAKFLSGLQTVIGLLIVFFALTQAIESYDKLFAINNLRGFLLPILLSIFSAPFVYLMALYSAYDLLFTRLDMGREKSSNLKRYAKIELFKYCKLNRLKVQKALNMNTYNIMSVENKQDVNDMINAYQKA